MKYRRLLLLPIVIVIAFGIVTYAQTSQPVFDGKLFQPLIGAWKLNLDKSGYQRNANSVAPKGRWVVYTIEGDGIRMSVYDDTYPQPKPTRSYFARLDGREYPNPHAPGLGETVALWPTDEYVTVRLVRTNGKPTERVTYAISADKKTLVWTSWDPETPWKLNVQVFDRIDKDLSSTTNRQP